MKEIKTDAEGNPVWQERFRWKIEELWWDLIDGFEWVWKGVVDIVVNPLWWALVVVLSGLLYLAFVLLPGWLR